MRTVHAAALVALLIAGHAAAQTVSQPLTPAQMAAAQKTAMERFAALDGLWRGTGWMVDAPGEPPRRMAETARVGPFLDGADKVIEVRGYAPDGSLTFHAFNTLSFDGPKGRYVMTARAAGREGTFSFRPSDNGYVWEIGGDGRGLRYTATIKDGVWSEVGESLAPDRAPVRVSEMSLRRIGSTDWPEAGAPRP